MKKDDKNVVLWANSSMETNNLKATFTSNDYAVEHVLTASPLPVAKSNAIYTSGVNQIKTSFGLKEVDHAVINK